MTEKGKRAQRRSEEDVVFNRMLLCLLGAVIAEIVVLLVKRFYVDMVSIDVASALLTFFEIFQYGGLLLTVAGIVWCIVSARKGKKLKVAGICTAAIATLWVIALLSYRLYDVGVRILMVLPAVAGVLILVYFLYQKAFFVNAILTGCGMAALWMYRQYYMTHPTAVTLCFVAGIAALVVVAVLAWILRKNNGKVGKFSLMMDGSSNLIYWLTCAITGVAMLLGLLLGVSAAYYLMFVLVGWLFCQAVYFTVKMM